MEAIKSPEINIQGVWQVSPEHKEKVLSITEHIITECLAVSYSVAVESPIMDKALEFLAVGVFLVRID